jgi:hypothetical protein
MRLIQRHIIAFLAGASIVSGQATASCAGHFNSLAASSMKSATSPGREIIGTWLD